ncbi:hypothetical protein G3I40_18860 [Streptomyces sp. SID14478]|uniref:hypothetical protein n=1 Tax=Streptomyces sp. SID14478 TaxID=2706073 RepID=UPI0013DB4A0F|nr:hypothetical protein [Streptomyces sp. SID14478]NEB77264.1 hypothetical protein [Streptomyces sp. SID14478]
MCLLGRSRRPASRSCRPSATGGGHEVSATAKGSAVVWDKRKADLLFAELRADRPVTVDG